jgi:uncharacterized glyoxalase superfamily protein PhnB
MEAKDGSSGFEFTGRYDKIEYRKSIDYTIDEGRKVKVSFISSGNETNVTESFEAEHANTIEMQQAGWQSILWGDYYGRCKDKYGVQWMFNCRVK